MSQSAAYEEHLPPTERISRESRAEILAHLVDLGCAQRQLGRRKTVGSIPDLLRKEAWEDAERECQIALDGASAQFGDESAYHALLCLCFADLAREAGEIERALGHAAAARAWALKHGERELLARSFVETTRAGLEVVRRREHSIPAKAEWLELYEEGLRVARDSGYGLLVIDLLLNRAELALQEGDATSARGLIERARVGSKKEGLLGAESPEASYARGKRRAQTLTAHLERGTRPASSFKTTSGEILIAYGSSDSPSLERLLEPLVALGGRDRIALWRDASAEPDRQRLIDAARVVVMLLGPQGPTAIEPLLVSAGAGATPLAIFRIEPAPTGGAQLSESIPGTELVSTRFDKRDRSLWVMVAAQLSRYLSRR